MMELSTLIRTAYRELGGVPKPYQVSYPQKQVTNTGNCPRSNHNVIFFRFFRQIFRQTLRTSKSQRRSLHLSRSKRQEVLPLPRQNGTIAHQHRQRRHSPLSRLLPQLEDAASIQSAISEVCELMLHRRIEPKEASALFY